MYKNIKNGSFNVILPSIFKLMVSVLYEISCVLKNLILQMKCFHILLNLKNRNYFIIPRYVIHVVFYCVRVWLVSVYRVGTLRYDPQIHVQLSTTSCSKKLKFNLYNQSTFSWQRFRMLSLVNPARKNGKW